MFLAANHLFRPFCRLSTLLSVKKALQPINSKNETSMRGMESRNARDSLKEDSILAYGSDGKSMGLDTMDNGLWCPVSREMVRPNSMRCAHIVPFSLGGMANYIFGSSLTLDILNQPENTLMLHEAVEEAMDLGRIAFTPVAPIDANKPSEFRLVILDKSILEEVVYNWKKVSQCACIKLEFLTDFRPSKRYLYLHFIQSLMAAQHKFSGWLDNYSDFAQSGIWMTPGKWVRESHMSYIRLRTLHLLPDSEEINRIFSGTFTESKDSPFIPTQDEYISSAVEAAFMHAYLPEDDEEGRDGLGDLVLLGCDKDAENALASRVAKLKSVLSRPGGGSMDISPARTNFNSGDSQGGSGLAVPKVRTGPTSGDPKSTKTTSDGDLNKGVRKFSFGQVVIRSGEKIIQVEEKITRGIQKLSDSYQHLLTKRPRKTPSPVEETEEAERQTTLLLR